MGSGHAQADGVEPGPELAFVVERFQAAEYDEKHLLADVVEIGAPESEALQRATNEAVVARKDVLEGELRLGHAPESPLGRRSDQVCVCGTYRSVNRLSPSVPLVPS